MVPMTSFSLTLPQTFRDSVEDSKSPPQRPQRLRSRNFLGKLPEEAVGDRAAPEQRKLGRAALLMMLVTGQGETTFPTSLCADPTRARAT
jgi:hypothetical protein